MTKGNESIGTKIHRELLKRGWTQSDLARHLWPGETIIDSRGYTAPKGRDRVSAWLADKQTPSAPALRRIAEVLEMDVNSLVPNALASVKEKEEPSLSINILAGAPDRAWVKINRLLPFKAALEIAAIIEKYEEK